MATFNKKQLTEFESVLLEEKKALLKELITSSSEYQSISNNHDIGDLVDQAFDTYEKDFLYEISKTEKETLYEIDMALERIAKKKYGTCEKCAKSIEIKRLKALPQARFCMKCKRSME